MNVLFDSHFNKSFKKRILPFPKLLAQFDTRFKIFRNNPQHPVLKDHSLKGEKQSIRSFWITGDIRVLYSRIDEKTALFLDIGSHNQVY